MELKLINAYWPTGGTLQEQFRRIKEQGYQGIEARPPVKENELEFKELLEQFEFDYVAKVVTDIDEKDHKAAFQVKMERAAEFSPILINAYSARDCMPFEEQLAFFESALREERLIGIPVAHETHRRRAMFAPWTTSRLLQALPDLKINADFSHWCCVCESLLEDQLEHLEQAIRHSIHVHGRIGYAQGPQVPHPEAPEYSRERQTFLGWWKQIFEHRKASGAAFLTYTPEFLTQPYMHTLPFTNQPVADAIELNVWMAQTFKEEVGGIG